MTLSGRQRSSCPRTWFSLYAAHTAYRHRVPPNDCQQRWAARCRECGHTARPGDPRYRCICRKCIDGRRHRGFAGPISKSALIQVIFLSDWKWDRTIRCRPKPYRPHVLAAFSPDQGATMHRHMRVRETDDWFKSGCRLEKLSDLLKALKALRDRER